MPMKQASTRLLRKGTGDIAVFVPFTRAWAVDRFFDSLAASDVPLERCRLVTFVDSDDGALLASVDRRSTALPFAEILSHCTAWPPPGERCRSRERRGRHAAMRSASVGLIPEADYLLLLEDDTTVPKNTWTLLSQDLAEGYDWVCGYEVGRWDCPVPGIWRIEGKNRIKSAEPGAGLERVDATGIYLVLTTPEVYRSRPWDVWDNAYGHDVSITYAMTLAGLKIGVDWRLECVHMTLERDWTVADCGSLTRTVGPHKPVLYSWPNTAPYTEFQSSGPRLIKQCEIDAPKRMDNPTKERMYTLGIDVEFMGEHYPRGSVINKPTARAMSDAGIIKAKIA